MAMFLVVCKHAKMHQNTFLTTPDGKKYPFQDHVSGGLEACENASNTFLTTPDVVKYLFYGHVFNHS
jgi:hypothetical protein